ncbi:MAG TPA: cellulase family glycosylhydrolase [Ktedonobacteraceae bacterium]|nr:cellulase family glycosylhydrolase [Ktedonobacteraceae bacterium]
MSRSLRIKLIGSFLIISICAAILCFQPFASFITHSNSSARASSPHSLTYHEFADGPYAVQGNQIIGVDNQPYIFHGIGRDGLEFTCTGGFFDAQHLAYMGPGTSTSGNTYWFANTVRLPLAQNIWLKGIANQCSAAQYQNTVKSVVDTLTAMHLNVILDLQWTDANGQARGGGAFQMTDNESLTFWRQIASIYSRYSNVLFEAFNEPHPASWTCWLSGCPVVNDNTYVGACHCKTPYTYQGVGMQALVNAIRGTGANNLILVAGMDFGYDLSQVLDSNQVSILSGSNIVYDTHPYPYAEKQPANWDASFGFLTSTYPVMSAESGEYDCQSGYMSQLISYFDAHSMGWVAWAWYAVGTANVSNECGYPQLISDFTGTPLPSMGIYIYLHFLGYAGRSPVLSGPVSTTWYFAEGRVGGGFKEYLTLENPGLNACAVTIQYLAQRDGGATFTKSVSVNVPIVSRVTRWVDGDLGTSPGGPGISDAAIITVDTSTTPGCAGIVAERPMYFNALGTNSGSDVLGVTRLGTTFYFGDLAQGNQPGGGNYSSFISILNPPGGQTATVTANYFAGGNMVASQVIDVAAGARGTIFANKASPALPARVAVVVTSTQPVAVERPTYFSNINGGNAGTVSGAADVVGVQNLSNDWLFAEGYTGGQFQENFVIANVDPANLTASVNINLEFSTGATQTYSIAVNPNSQVVWSVNKVAPGQSVSAEITSTGANILVEREMFFRYSHKADGRSLSSIGGTDVLGQVGPAASSSYSFAEGYTNIGYDEWLTLQNPTNSTENINITLVNEAGGIYPTSISVGAHSRATVDITGAVIHGLSHAGNGYQSYEVSMVAQSSSGPFVAERPMYWNTSGTQGGTDVIGYSGG